VKGPPWLLLRGLMRETRHWGDFPAQLADAAGVAVHTLDLPGNGRRYALPSPASVAELAADVHAQWQGLGGGPVRVLALSLGGMVAIDWARQFPEVVADLVLCNTSVRPYSTPWQRFQPRAWPRLARLLLGRPGADVVERDILRLTSARPDAHQDRLADWQRWRTECPVSRANLLRQLRAAAAYRAPIRAPVATRILCSRGDRLVAARCSERLAAAWAVPLQSHPDAGHDLPLDDPEWVIAAVRASDQADS
jgi:pimeloyl-ACP methyl ester carboxylesterase